MESVIVAFQMGIWIIISVMVFLIILFVYLLSFGPKKKNNTQSMSNDWDSKEYENNVFNEDDGLNSSSSDDEGPIQHL